MSEEALAFLHPPMDKEMDYAANIAVQTKPNHQQHPLDPLTSYEIAESSKLIQMKYPGRRWHFNTIDLIEPPKALVIKYLSAGQAGKNNIFIPRRSLSIMIEKYTGKVFEIIVNLSEGEIEKLIEVPFGNQPCLTIEDTLLAEEITKKDVEVQKRLAKLGLENLDLVEAEPWVIGYEGLDPELRGKRIVQSFMYARNFDGDNHFAHPLDFAPIVDLTSEEVVLIEDLPIHSDHRQSKSKSENNQYPKTESNYDYDLIEDDEFLRRNLKPIQVIQPKGPSFYVKGNEIEWGKFRMRVGFNSREGLVLYNVTYKDGNRIRPLIYRASLGEMMVPYGDPRPVYHRKCAYDVGEYGLGFSTNSLELGCDCLGTIHYFDEWLCNHDGQPVLIKNAICLHEEDSGLLFKHTEYRNGKISVARSRKLILSFIVTIANYEYGIYWNFYLDGTIQFEVKATGIVSTAMIADGETPGGCGSKVMPNVNAQFHQHIYAMRLDTMFDGIKNTVSTVDVKPLDGDTGSKSNPFGNGFTAIETPIKNIKENWSDASIENSRFWKIFNPSSINPITGKPASWKLIPTNPFKFMAKPKSPVYEQSGFAKHSLWVLPYKEDQLFPAGKYINSITPELNGGLMEWIAESKTTPTSIENEDIVVWHIFGTSHIPRVEDFPIMNTDACGFMLKPCNFFTTNPALDVPPPDRKENNSIYAFEKSCCNKY